MESSDVIKPIPFACASAPSDTNAIAIGNGFTNDSDRKVPPILQYTELKTISKLSCLFTWPSLILRQGVVCAKGEEHRSVCNGDSGGPLITTNNSLIGLASFGSTKGCESGYPQVFTLISFYQQWIKEVAGVDCKK